MVNGLRVPQCSAAAVSLYAGLLPQLAAACTWAADELLLLLLLLG
jgi:hypothetical protein